MGSQDYPIAKNLSLLQEPQLEQMIVVIPVCNKDYALVEKNLGWWKELDGRVDIPCFISWDEEVGQSRVEHLKRLAGEVFPKVADAWYPSPVKKSWPAAPNWAWQNTARYIAAIINQPWFWVEADCVALRPGWLKDIKDEYYRARKPFMGHIVHGMGHINGSMVYPPNVAQFSQAAFMTEEAAWDVVLGRDLNLFDGGILSVAHYADKLFAHCWCIGPDGKCWNGSGEVPSFKHPSEIPRLVDVRMAVFHRCKDGSLIDQLRLFYKDPSSAMVPQVAHEHQKPEISSVVEERKAAPDTTSKAEFKFDPASVKYKGKAEIFIVSYPKDYPWLDYCLKSIAKFCHGFSGVTVLVPNKGAEAVKGLREYELATWRFFNEHPEKGKLHQMVHECRADEWCPDADIVLHFDSDCIFHTHTTPDEYVKDDMPVMLKRSYSGLYDPKNKVWSDCAQWKSVVEKALKIETDTYTMCRHPSAHPIWLYSEMRRWIEKKQGKPFDRFVMEGKNQFPQTFAEYPTLGAFAWANHRSSYHWIDIDNNPPPKDMQKTYWSHGGITPAIRDEIEAFLK